MCRPLTPAQHGVELNSQVYTPSIFLPQSDYQEVDLLVMGIMFKQEGSGLQRA